MCGSNTIGSRSDTSCIDGRGSCFWRASMSELNLRPWKSSHLSADPYLERREPDIGKLDDALHNAIQAILPRPVEDATDLKVILAEVDSAADDLAVFDDAGLR